MSKDTTLNLPTDYALVLQQIQEDEEDDIATLSIRLHLNQNRLWHIVKALQRQGLVMVNAAHDEHAWVKLSRKGMQVMDYIWPETQFAA
jgi:DNA-binding IclR family transcriptional regulator